jgi:hypothetical protein
MRMHQNAATGMMGTIYAPTNAGFFLPQGIHQNQRAPQFIAPTLATIPNGQLRSQTPRWNNNNMGGYSKRHIFCCFCFNQ